jgi:hypothetical protein
MQAMDFRRRQFLRVLASLGLLSVPRTLLAAGEPIAVVMGSSSGQRALSSDKLRRIFLATPTDDDEGHRFVPINLGQTTSVRERFDRSVLKLSPDEVARYWIDQRLRGNKPPRSASTVELVRRAVQEMPGAISYLPLSAASGLRLVAIDGRSPNDSGYLLR